MTPFNVAAQGRADPLRAAADAGAVFSPWQPVSLSRPGAPTDPGGSDEVRRVLAPIAVRHGATIPQVAPAWLSAFAANTVPGPAPTSLAHLRENLEALDLGLEPEDLTAVDGLGDRPLSRS